MTSLNLPSYNYKIKEIEGKTYIFDFIRKKYLVLTPEEWVRQHFINLLVSNYQYPKSLIKLEGGLKYNSLQKRSDIVVFDREGKPLLLVECKETGVKIDKKVVEQASRYNLTLKCKYLVVTNGIQTFCFEIDFENEIFVQLKDIPLNENL
jgi:predicted type IV restriction endonuclease